MSPRVLVQFRLLWSTQQQQVLLRMRSPRRLGWQDSSPTGARTSRWLPGLLSEPASCLAVPPWRGLRRAQNHTHALTPTRPAPQTAPLCAHQPPPLGLQVPPPLSFFLSYPPSAAHLPLTACPEVPIRPFGQVHWLPS